MTRPGTFRPGTFRPGTFGSGTFRSGASRPGTTLAELLAALTLAALLAAAAAHAVAALADGAAAHAAGAELRSAFATARTAAARRGARVAVHLDTAAARAVIHAGPDTLHVVPLGPAYAISLAVTRDSMAYTPLGLGYGAANLRAVVTRGRAADTVTLSRLGRVR